MISAAFQSDLRLTVFGYKAEDSGRKQVEKAEAKGKPRLQATVAARKAKDTKTRSCMVLGNKTRALGAESKIGQVLGT